VDDRFSGIISRPALLKAVEEGRAVLFMGAGASCGAKDEKGNKIPDGKELSLLIARKFLGAEYEGLDFRSTCDLACNQRDVGTVQRFIFETLNPFQPAHFHKLISTFAWAGLAGTNYDLIVERAYPAAKSPLQKLVPNTKDGDGATDRLGDRSVLYVKLHGCITRHGETAPPLIASTEQLISFRDGREGQFATFLEWAKTKTLIFCGYAFLDSNLRMLFDEIIKEGDKRPKHYIINKGLRSAEADYWRDRRVEAIDASFEEFLTRLTGSVTFLRDTFGFIKCEALKLDAFFVVLLHALECADYLAEGAAVHFNLAFTLRGPVAIDIRM